MKKIRNVNLAKVEADARYHIVNALTGEIYLWRREIQSISNSAFGVAGISNASPVEVFELSNYLVTDNYLRLFKMLLEYTNTHDFAPEFVFNQGYSYYEYWSSPLRERE